MTQTGERYVRVGNRTVRRATVFVLSDVRSGSTLLDQCLGSNPMVASLGEVHWLTAYLTQNRSLYDPDHPLVCACGMLLSECPFWISVEQHLGRPLESLRSRQGLKREKGESAFRILVRHLPRRLIKTKPWLYRSRIARSIFDGRRFGRDCLDLYDAASAASGRPVCVDSSKSPFRFRDVYELDPQRTFAIVLCRDYRAVVHSKMKRGQSLESAARGWRRAMQQIDALTCDLPPSRVLQTSYERFCAVPRLELERICAFLGLEFAERMLERAGVESHHIGGSPTKFDPARSRIMLDNAFESQIDPSSLRRIQAVVGDAAKRWGY